MSKSIPKLISLQALTFLHPGTGQSTGVVDLPVQREIHTEFPMYASSGFKGSLREKAETGWETDNKDNKITTLFGAKADVNDVEPSAGAFSITDARLLAFPVRSLQQVFMWITCPMVLKRLHRDCKLTRLHFDLNTIPSVEQGHAKTCNNTLSSPLMLEEISFEVNNEDKTIKNIADKIKYLTREDANFDPQHLLILNDDDFKYLVKNGTQVSARIKLNEDKTTTGKGGNLWYEETLPPETLFYSLILFHNPRKPMEQLKNAGEVAASLEEIMADGFIQIGGNETVGQGWCSVKITPEAGDS